MNNLVLPPWSIAHNPNKLLFPGVQLATRDGRVMGNAHIIGCIYFQEETLYIVLTDAGNKVKLFTSEVHEIFYITEWVSNVEEVKRKFLRGKELEN